MVRQRSAERYTAWRRETCGAQPVAGKRPVRDSQTNPVRRLHPRDEVVLASDNKVEERGGVVLKRSMQLPPAHLLSLQIQRQSKTVELTLELQKSARKQL